MFATQRTSPVAVPEPKIQTNPDPSHRSYHGRWRWWYSGICDLRLLQPGITNRELAVKLGKSEGTISAITNTDMYKEYEAQRRQANRDGIDSNIRDRLSEVTLLGLDAMRDKIKKQGDQVPLEIAREVVSMGLESLGFGPKPAPTVQITNQQNVSLGGVTAEALDEARAALRAVERQQLYPPVLELEAGPSADQSLPGLDSSLLSEHSDKN